MTKIIYLVTILSDQSNNKLMDKFKDSVNFIIRQKNSLNNIILQMKVCKALIVEILLGMMKRIKIQSIITIKNSCQIAFKITKEKKYSTKLKKHKRKLHSLNKNR